MNAQRLRTKLALSLAVAAGAAAVQAAHIPHAHACGCFAQSNPSVPIVQAGERIVFGMEDGNVVAHIQIQYSGNPGEFGWLIPLPAIPDVQVGTDELFTELINLTQPSYRLNRVTDDSCPDFDRGNAGDNGSGGSGGAFPGQAPAPEDSPLVFASEIGPYSYAVLEADSKQPMLDWLTENGYFVPANADAAIDGYIRPNSYFLAVKLQSGADVGDLQPIVLRYPSELPMIPIVLTSAGATEDMPVLVWVLGEHRAIPRNYYHTQINDAAIDWLNSGSNYIEVITRAVDDAEGHHSFVTEYAGINATQRLDPEGRFGSREELAAIADAQAYIGYLNQHFGSGVALPLYSNQALAVLGRHLPMPSRLRELGYTPLTYYRDIDYLLNDLRQGNPELFEDLDLEYDPGELTAELWDRVVTPTLEAGRFLRERPYVTRLFTTLSPEEMTLDPVFSFNPDLPEVSNIHTATLRITCDYDVFSGEQRSAQIETEQGWVLYLPDGEFANDWQQANLPWSLATEVLREEGPAEVVQDNRTAVDDAINDFRPPPSSSGGGCAAAPLVFYRGGISGLALLGLLFLLSGVILRRRA